MVNVESIKNNVIAVIIVNYKTPELLVSCLISLEQERKFFPDLHVFVIDNASPDNSAQYIQRSINQYGWHSWVNFTVAEKNGGYAYGNNIGFAIANQMLASIDYFWMLNPDTRVLPGATAGLVEFLSGQPNSIAGSCLQYEDGTKQTSAFNFPSVISEMCSGLGLGIVDRLLRDYIVFRDIPDVREKSDWLAGASLMFSAVVQSRLGDLDEAYFLYFEEVDYLFKAKRKGIYCWYVPDSKVVHEVGAATGISDIRKRAPRRPSYWFESRRRFFLKNYSFLYLLAADIMWILGRICWCIRKLLFNRAQLQTQPPMMLFDFIRHSSLNPVSWFR